MFLIYLWFNSDFPTHFNSIDQMIWIALLFCLPQNAATFPQMFCFMYSNQYFPIVFSSSVRTFLDFAPAKAFKIDWFMHVCARRFYNWTCLNRLHLDLYIHTKKTISLYSDLLNAALLSVSLCNISTDRENWMVFCLLTRIIIFINEMLTVFYNEFRLVKHVRACFICFISQLLTRCVRNVLTWNV